MLRINTMLITPVDDKNNLFLVENVLPTTLLEAIQHEKLLEYKYTRDFSGHLDRRKLIYDEASPFSRIDNFLTDNINTISKAIGKKLVNLSSNVWMDDPGFNMGIHIDNLGVTIAMQLYLTKGPIDMGTKFYYDNDDTMLRYDFPYKLNCGYIMINDDNQWHGFPKPSNSYRVSSYTYLHQ